MERLERRLLLTTTRVNVGGPTLPGDQVFLEDDGFHDGAGRVTRTRRDIDMSGVDAGLPMELFQSARRGTRRSPELQFSIPSNAGSEYQVDLFFSEIWRPAFRAGRRVFDVLIEGQQVLDDFDIFAAAGARAAHTESFNIISDGFLNIDLLRVRQNPVIAGIQITEIGSNGNRPPAISAIGDQVIGVGQSSGPITFSVSDPDGDAVTVTGTSDNVSLVPDTGIVIAGAGPNSTVTVTPVGGATGTATISLTASDGSLTDTEAFQLTVNAQNAAPVAVADVATVQPGMSVNIPVLANDTDSDGTLNSTSVSIVQASPHGSAVVQNDGTVDFTPVDAFIGTTTFRYTVQDDRGAVSAPGEVTVTVADAPPEEFMLLLNAGGPTVGQYMAGSEYHSRVRRFAPRRTIQNVPADIPEQVFQSVLWDAPRGEGMHFDIPLPAGEEYQVDLLFSEIWRPAYSPGRRVFDVMIDDNLVLDDLDIFAEAGSGSALIKSFNIIGDGNLDIDLVHVVQNPAIAGIRVTRNQLTDTDNDGLSDVSERLTHGTDPTKFDTDGDLLGDGFEVGPDGLDPLVPNDINADPDADNLTNLDEQRNRTRPMNADSDGDGTPDGTEVDQGSDPNDASDMGAAPPPGELLELQLTVGDHSGSHSERYDLIVGNIVHQATQFGVVETNTYKFRRGMTYDIEIRHRGTKLDQPDFDYTAMIAAAAGATGTEFIIEDPGGILGRHDESDPFFAAGKTAKLIIPKLETIEFATNAAGNPCQSFCAAANFTDFLVGAKQPSIDVRISPDTAGSTVSWTVTPLTAQSGTVVPSSGNTMDFSFQPNVSGGVRPTSGSRSANAPVSYRVDFTITKPDGQVKSDTATINQNTRTVLRQEYVDYGLVPPAIGDVGSSVSTANFQGVEFSRNSNYSPIVVNGGMQTIAQATRNAFGKPIIVTSAYRNPQRNKAVGGAGTSVHMSGGAVDLTPGSASMIELYRAAISVGPGLVLLERGPVQLLPGNWNPPAGTHVFMTGNGSVTVSDTNGDSLPDTVSAIGGAAIASSTSLAYQGGGSNSPAFSVVDGNSNGFIDVGEPLVLNHNGIRPLSYYFQQASHVHADNRRVVQRASP